jgi:hypothetical protein
MRTDRLTRAGHAPAIFFIGAGSITCSRRTGLCRCVHLITVSDGLPKASVWLLRHNNYERSKECKMPRTA